MHKPLLLSLFLLGPAFSQGADLQNRLSTLVEQFQETHSFMGTVVITHGGKTVFEKSVGLADVAKNLPNTADTLYRIASLTKSFTGVAVLKLQEEGKLKVTDALSKYLPGYPNAENITLHHLLTHTSGIANYTELPDYRVFEEQPLTLPELTLKFQNLPVHFAPGEAFRYNNSGYILLGRVIERASGMKYEQYVQQHVLAPMGFEKTGFFRPEDAATGQAVGHIPINNTHMPAGHFSLEVSYAAGGLSSTARELARWLPGLLEGKVLNATSVQQFMGPHVPVHTGHYAYGIHAGKLLGRPYLNHTGLVKGFSSLLGYFPEEQIGVVVLSNVQGPDLYALFTRLYMAYRQTL